MHDEWVHGKWPRWTKRSIILRNALLPSCGWDESSVHPYIELGTTSNGTRYIHYPLLTTSIHKRRHGLRIAAVVCAPLAAPLLPSAA